jgi:hypothetical protein
MGIYEYQCPVGHVTELMAKLENRPATIKCDKGEPLTCGRDATPILSATPTSFRQNDRKAFKRQGH